MCRIGSSDLCSQYDDLNIACCSVHLFMFRICSMAIHPSKTKIASGQVAGVEMDGKVHVCFCILNARNQLENVEPSCYVLKIN